MKTLALDIGGTAIKLAELDRECNILSFREVPSEGKNGGENLIAKVKKLIGEYEGFDRIGISTAGQVDITDGSIVFANDNIPGYTGMKVRQLFEDFCNVPVRVENDVNAAAIGEAFYGAGKAYNDFLCLTFGTGIGGAIVVDKQIYRGANGVAGELGHMITHPNGKLCACGMYGCYEQYSSTTALVNEARRLNPAYKNGRVIFDELWHDNKLKYVVDKWINEIIIGLINLVHIFNPRCFVLGGGILNENYITQQIDLKLKDRIMVSFNNIDIHSAALGNKAGLLGIGHVVNQV